MSLVPPIARHDPFLAPSSRFPCLDSTSIRFWKQKGLDALHESDGTQTKLIIQFVPIKDHDEVVEVLNSRWDSELDALLETERRASLSETTTDNRHLAQELVTLLLPARSGVIWPIAWEVPNPNCENPATVADNIHAAVIDTFFKIGLEDWGRCVFRMEDSVVIQFLQWASNMSASLRARYTGQSREGYEQLEKVCLATAGWAILTDEQKLREPGFDCIAHWIVAKSFDLISIAVEQVLEPLILAIRDFYAKKIFQLDYLAILNQQFMKLTERYDSNWLALAGDYSFLELISSEGKKVKKIAQCMADRAYDMYAQFKPADFEDKESVSRSSKIVLRQSNLLSYMVRDYVNIRPDLYDRIINTAQVYL
jgi:hypothetical protein